jgi:hypothetical protein
MAFSSSFFVSFVAIPCGENRVDKAYDKVRDKGNPTQIPETLSKGASSWPL